jgi:protein O-GlcNAc transferase
LPRDILRESLRAAEHLTRSVRPRPQRAAQPLAGRDLRVGWVSADLRDHPVGSGILAVLPYLAAHRIEIVAYSNVLQTDRTSHQIAAQVALWRDASGLSDEALADQISADGIDVLIDLSGRTRGHRLGVFARRAAPVQVCWLGWFSTSGLPQIDWYLGDRMTLPESEAELFAEPRWVIDGPYYVQTPRALSIPTAANGEGAIRFGCFNNLAKLSTRTLDLWAKVLLAVPGATLFLKARELADREIVAGLEQEFARRGVPAGRLRVAGQSPLAEYLQAFNEIDLSLDPTPYTGGATTFDSLWMGVPVLTLAGDRYIAHQGESLLGRVGLDDWIAPDEAGYLARAQAAAAQLAALREGRSDLRERFLASPLVDGAALAGQLASAWHGMHDQALAGRAPARLPADPVALEITAAILHQLEDWPAAQAAWQAVAEKATDPAARAQALAQAAIALQRQPAGPSKAVLR